jgi:hypothetical protein
MEISILVSKQTISIAESLLHSQPHCGIIIFPLALYLIYGPSNIEPDFMYTLYCICLSPVYIYCCRYNVVYHHYRALRQNRNRSRQIPARQLFTYLLNRLSDWRSENDRRENLVPQERNICQISSSCSTKNCKEWNKKAIFVCRRRRCVIFSKWLSHDFRSI